MTQDVVAPPPTRDELLQRQAALRQQQAALRSQIEAHMRAADNAPEPEDARPHLEALKKLQTEMRAIEDQLLALDKQLGSNGLIVNKATGVAVTRGAEKMRLDVAAYLELAQVPTSICHLLDPEKTPLVRVTVTNRGDVVPRRVRVRSYIEGYTAKAASTVELRPRQSETVRQLPTFFPEKLHDLGELTLATLHVIVDDLESKTIELHETRRVWLLARNSAPIKVKRPAAGEFTDMRPYHAAFVTPHRREVLEYLSVVANYVPDGRLDGYFARDRDVAVVLQPRAIYLALQEDLKLRYVSSFIDFNPDSESESQRVRLPRESLGSRQANCLDGAVLFASLLEAISLKPALVYAGGHAMVAWQDDGVSDKWTVLDTTKMDRADFDRACEWGQFQAEQSADPQDYKMFRVEELRKKEGITPLE